MKRPLRDFIEQEIKKQTVRMYMPGHKGKEEGLFSSLLPYDITEIQGADYLYEATGILKEIEDYAASLFGSGTSLMSVGGSSQSICAMFKLAVPVKGKVLADRNCHISAIHAMALLDIDPIWLYPQVEEKTGLTIPFEAKQIESALIKDREIRAVFLTSPNYFGRTCDIKEIVKVCEKHKVKLMVDNAHGAILHFLNESKHPISLGADFCCDSLHKTLPALTGTGLLHIKEKQLRQEAKAAMGLFGSTSPSYLLMLSIEECLYNLSNVKNEIKKMQTQVKKVNEVAKKLELQVVTDNHLLRICISGWEIGYTGEELASHLRSFQIEPEYISDNFVVLLPSVKTSEVEYKSIISCLKSIKKRKGYSFKKIEMHQTKTNCSLRRALLGETELVKPEEAMGRIAAESLMRCPPGIAVLLPGEEIDNKGVAEIKKSGISRVKVVK